MGYQICRDTAKIRSDFVQRRMPPHGGEILPGRPGTARFLTAITATRPITAGTMAHVLSDMGHGCVLWIT